MPSQISAADGLTRLFVSSQSVGEVEENRSSALHRHWFSPPVAGELPKPSLSESFQNVVQSDAPASSVAPSQLSSRPLQTSAVGDLASHPVNPLGWH